MPFPAGSLPTEIQERLRKRYLDRLAQRVKKMRRLVAEKDWLELRGECIQLKSSESFGYRLLTELASRAVVLIPERGFSRAAALPEAKASIEGVISAIDNVLTENDVHRE